tara:strand:- start:996 stop:1277 length:282 start_codon:yes stop_codon:yes gene_type:complete
MSEKPSFDQVYNALHQKGPAQVCSSRGVKYEVEARQLSERRAIVGHLVKKRGRVYIHEDCWLDAITCQKSRAGGLYNGKYTIFDWYNDHIGNG